MIKFSEESGEEAGRRRAGAGTKTGRGSVKDGENDRD